MTRSDASDLADCVRQPLKAYKANRRAINLALKALRDESNPAQRRRLLNGIDRATSDQGRLARQIDECNFDYLAKKAAARDTCRRNPNASPPAPPGPSPLPPPPPPAPGEQPNTACLNCQSVGGKCCMRGAELCACANPTVDCSRYGC